MTHPIPDIVLETDIAILGMKGAGKSFAAKGLVERVLDMGRRVCILDPLCHWWGLKAKADGSPGYPMVIIGGEHADIALDPLGGDTLGRVIAETHHSFILDVSDLTRSELIRFSTEFLLSIYRHNREALWLVAEEADVFGPQQPAMDGTRAMLDMMDQIARRGRQRGFRLWSVTQRPARLNKDILSMASALVLMRIRGPQDRSAAEDWVLGHASKAETKLVVDGLAGLEVGQGYVYAPDVEMVEKVRFPMITTMDTSRTPKAGEKRLEIQEVAQVDLTALRAALAPASPDLAAESAAPAHGLSARQKQAIEQQAFKKGVTVGYRQGVLEGINVIEPLLHTLQARLTAPESGYDDDEIDMELGKRPADQISDSDVSSSASVFSAAAGGQIVDHGPGGTSLIPGRALSRPQQHLLDTLIWLEANIPAEHVDRGRLAFLAEVSHTSSGYQNNLSALSSAGFVTYPSKGLVALTPAGRQRATVPRRTKTNADLQQAVLRRLTRPQQVILNALIRIYPRRADRPSLALEIGVSPTSSGYQNNLSRLSTLGLITYPERGQLLASGTLFPFGKLHEVG